MTRARVVSGYLLMAAASGLVYAQTEFSGLVEPFRDVLLSPAVQGRIAKLPFNEGDRVEEGDLLLELDARVEELEVQRRKAIFEDDSELLAARERLSLLQEELESTRDLAERTGSVSREELNRKQLETVLAQLEITRLEQTRERQRIELEMAGERLKQQRITTPFSGVLAQMPLDVGESVQPNQPAMRLVDDEQAFLVVNIPAERARSLELGQFAPAPLYWRTGWKTGEVAFMSPVVDPASGLRHGEMRFENRDPKVEPGIAGHWIDGDGHEEFTPNSSGSASNPCKNSGVPSAFWLELSATAATAVQGRIGAVYVRTTAGSPRQHRNLPNEPLAERAKALQLCPLKVKWNSVIRRGDV